MSGKFGVERDDSSGRLSDFSCLVGIEEDLRGGFISAEDGPTSAGMGAKCDVKGKA